MDKGVPKDAGLVERKMQVWVGRGGAGLLSGRWMKC